MSAPEILPYDYQDHKEWFIRYYRSKGRYWAKATHDIHSQLTVSTSGPGAKKWVECHIVMEIEKHIDETATSIQGRQTVNETQGDTTPEYQCCVCDRPSTGPVCDDYCCGANAFKAEQYETLQAIQTASQSPETSADGKRAQSAVTDQEAVLQALRNNGYRTE